MPFSLNSIINIQMQKVGLTFEVTQAWWSQRKGHKWILNPETSWAVAGMSMLALPSWFTENLTADLSPTGTAQMPMKLLWTKTHFCKLIVGFIFLTYCCRCTLAIDLNCQILKISTLNHVFSFDLSFGMMYAASAGALCTRKKGRVLLLAWKC